MFAGIDTNDTESIAAHSYKVASIALIFGTKFKEENYDVNLGNILKASIVHDWTDCIISDLPKSSKSFQSYFKEDIKSILENAENNAFNEIEQYLKDIVDLNLIVNELNNVESAILHLSDITALLLEILEWKYKGLNYDWFDFMWANTLERLKSIISDYSFLKDLPIILDQAYQKGSKPSNPFLTKPQFQTKK
jgi:putative hydrolase of HD superfamily